MLKKGMKKIAFLLAVSFMISFPLHAEVVDRILVIINEEIITQGEIDRMLVPVYERYQKEYEGEELIERLDAVRRGIVQNLIKDKLLLSEAKRRNIEVDQLEIDAKIEEVRKRFATQTEFEMALEKENLIISELEKKYKERFMIDKIVQVQIGRNITVSPNEMITFYEENKTLFKEPEKVKVRTILIRINDELPEEKASKTTAEIHRRLLEGCNFELLAKEYSQGPYKDRGGDMGWIKKGELMDELNEMIFSMEKDEISSPIKTRLGFHIFMVEDKMEPSIKDFSEAKDRIEKALYNSKIEGKLREWVEELKKNAYIAFK